METEDSKTSRTTLVTFLALLLCFLVATIRMVRPYLLAVSTGAITALLAYPFYLRIRKRGVSPKLASLVTTLAVLILVVGPLTFFLTRMVQQGISIGQALASNDGFSFQGLLDRIGHLNIVRNLVGDPAVLEGQLRNSIQSLAKRGTALIVTVAGGVPGILLQLALALVSCFFLMIDGRKFLNWLTDKIPLDSDVRARLLKSFKDTTISVIWATLAAAGVQALVLLVGFLVLGIPAALLAAGATFIFAWIPMVGSAPVWLAGALYLYLQGSIGKCIMMVFIGLFTGIIDNFVRPWVLKGRSSMHPLVALIAIFGGIQMFGIMGVFLGPVLVAVTTALLQTWPIVGRRAGILSSAPPVVKKT